VAEARLGLPREHRVEREGWKLLFEHGHRFDRSVAGLGPDLMMWIMGRLRRLGLRTFCDFWERYVLELVHGMVMGDALARGAEALVRDEGWHVVVMGHTHRTRCSLVPDGRGLYANAGACTAKHPRYLSIDTGAGAAAVREFGGRGGSIDLATCALPARW
jgi:hypothetical protein